MLRVLVTGTGRAGTSYLMLVLKELGLSVLGESKYNNSYRAGLELGSGKYVKDPAACLDMGRYCTTWDIAHVIIPVRKFYDVAVSREKGGLVWPKKLAGYGTPTTRLAGAFAMLMSYVVLNQVPYTTLPYPLFVKDEDLFWRAMDPIFQCAGDDVKKECFIKAARKVRR